MRDRKLKAGKSGVVKQLGPKGHEKKFRLGFDPKAAAAKWRAITTIWRTIEDEAALIGIKPTWTDDLLAAARSIEKGETPKVSKRDYEPPSRYVERLQHLSEAAGMPILPKNDFLYRTGQADIAQDVQRGQRILSMGGIRQKTGQTLHDAIRAYQAHIRREYLDTDGHLTDNGKTKLDQLHAILTYIEDRDLGELDWQGCDDVFGVFRRRPVSQRYKKPMARKSCVNYIGELGRFFRWLHLSRDWHWRKPEDFDHIVRSPRELDADIEAEAADVPVFTVDQLKILFETALPLERVFLLLSLNCAYGADQLGRLQVRHVHLGDKRSYINRIRRKKKTRSIHLLWEPTIKAIQWVLSWRPMTEHDILLVNERGKPYWYKTQNGNRAPQIPNIWYRLLDRVCKSHPSFPRLGFNSMRDTSGQMIRDIAGEETASLHLAHKHQSRDENLRHYTNPVRKRHFKALRKMERKLAVVFAALGPELFAERRRNYIGLEKVKQIQELHEKGTPIMAIARQLSISQGTVYRHLAKQPIDG